MGKGRRVIHLKINTKMLSEQLFPCIPHSNNFVKKSWSLGEASPCEKITRIKRGCLVMMS